MPRLQRDIVIGARPEAVFALLSQPERLPEWTPGVLSVMRTSPGPVGVGSTTETVVEAFGVRQTLLGRCTAFEVPRRLVVENITASGITVGGVSIGRSPRSRPASSHPRAPAPACAPAWSTPCRPVS
jgi:carbon monoxide dehydrogenase subunit G